jgi:para-nitrobenzyl esterase
MRGLDEGRARLGCGSLAGELLPRGVKVFRGIPYAAPPVGPRRWAPPEGAPAWQGIRSALSFGSPAPQSPRDGDPRLSEDCLYLNVWTPAASSSEALPVLFWIHGGSFTIGSGSEALYDCAALAETGIVAVTVNYRLGALGFLAHPELSAASPNLSSGNYGLRDQLAALAWVRDNIAAFGGDPGAITVGGQSAGALSVCALLASPAAASLFARAIVMSGPPQGLEEYFQSRKEGEAAGERFMAASGAGNIAELRARPLEALVGSEAWNSFEARITVDGRLLPEHPAEAIAAGRLNPASVLAGCTSLEFSGGSSAEADAKALAMLAGTAAIAEAAAKLGQAAYLYRFARLSRGERGERYGAAHGADLPYLFRFANKGALAPTDDRTWTPEDYEFSDLLAAYWSNFIKRGDPNGGDLPPWPRRSAEEDRLMELGDGTGSA